MLTLADFLLARIAEQERAARKLAERDRRPLLSEFPAVDHPTFILADLEAKRRIVERCAAVDYAMPSTHLAHGVLGLLALPYADHDDYDERWRP